MSQYHALPRFSLAATPVPNKVLITLFLAGASAALVLAVYAFYEPTGLTAAGVVEYYRGNESNPAATTLKMEKSRGELIEWIHIHSFSTLILVFVLCHFVQLTRRPDGWKVIFYVATFSAWAAMMAGPWIVRFHEPGFAVGLLIAGAVFATAAVLGAVATLAELWLGRKMGPSSVPVPLVEVNGSPGRTEESE